MWGTAPMAVTCWGHWGRTRHSEGRTPNSRERHISTTVLRDHARECVRVCACVSKRQRETQRERERERETERDRQTDREDSEVMVAGYTITLARLTRRTGTPLTARHRSIPKPP